MRIGILDLNNFARYPTLSVGYIVSGLRSLDHDVTVVSPLASGVQGFDRVMRPPPFGHYESTLRHYTAVTRIDLIRRMRRRLADLRTPARASAQEPTLRATRRLLQDGVDLVMISAYTMYRDLCIEICREAAGRGVPVVVGGPMFSVPEVAAAWLGIPGISAVYSGEAEAHLTEILNAAVDSALPAPPGFLRPGKQPVTLSAPLADLDGLAFPDFSDFPWERYPNRIIPMMTGRGCGWGVCTFCSDVLTTSGRTFRSRSIGNVLDEMAFQSDRHATRTFTFLDLKLNSDADVWNGLIDGAQDTVPGCEWTASLHVNINGTNGLSFDDLKRARTAGLSRVTTGLESGSRRVLNAMARGTNPEALSQFVRNASKAGISVRMTCIIGHPDETPEDVDQTTAFLSAHYPYVDRIVVNRLAISPLTPLGRMIDRRPTKYPQIEDIRLDTETGLLDHRNATFNAPGHFAATRRLLQSVHRINRKPLRGASLTFEGVM